LRLKPRYAEAHVNWALLLENQGHWEAAEAHLKQALLLKPDFPAARESLQRVERQLHPIANQQSP